MELLLSTLLEDINKPNNGGINFFHVSISIACNKSWAWTREINQTNFVGLCAKNVCLNIQDKMSFLYINFDAFGVCLVRVHHLVLFWYVQYHICPCNYEAPVDNMLFNIQLSGIYINKVLIICARTPPFSIFVFPFIILHDISLKHCFIWGILKIWKK